ncbi:hypothetical protein CLD22_17230 [Rubrivivax gelatinosus]|nr:hypothetical protein [Rubrivivax gelatinosus]
MLLVSGVAWLAFTPNPPLQAAAGWDKGEHALAFALLALSAVRAFPAAPRLVHPGALLGYGVLIEIVQAYVPGRSSEAADVLADLAGILLGSLVAAGWRRIAPD